MRRAVVALPVTLALAGAAMLALFIAKHPGDLPMNVVVPIFYNVPLVLAFAVVGAAIVWRHARHPVGWLLYAVATMASFGTLTEGYTAWRGPGQDWLLWAWSMTSGPLYAALSAALLLFPTGVPPSRRWVVLGRTLAVYAV